MRYPIVWISQDIPGYPRISFWGELADDDINEEFIESVLLHSINSGNEARPDWTSGGEGGSGGYGRAP